jgi:hypothetical protein
MICCSLEAPDKNTFGMLSNPSKKPILDQSHGIASLEERRITKKKVHPWRIEGS